MKNKGVIQSKQLSLDDKMTVMANLFIDRIIEEHELRLKLKLKTPNISSRLSMQ